MKESYESKLKDKDEQIAYIKISRQDNLPR